MWPTLLQGRPRDHVRRRRTSSGRAASQVECRRVRIEGSGELGASSRGARTMNKAYVTMLCNGDGYVTGAEVLGKSLEASGTKVPRVAMVTADISPAARARLTARGWGLRDVEPIANPTPDALLVFPRFAAVFTKLRAWELTEF